MADTKRLPRGRLEDQGVAAGGIREFVNAVSGQELHSFILLRHGHVVAEAWCMGRKAAALRELGGRSVFCTYFQWKWRRQRLGAGIRISILALPVWGLSRRRGFRPVLHHYAGARCCNGHYEC